MRRLRETTPPARTTRRLTRERLRALVRDQVLGGDPVPEWHAQAACQDVDTEVFFPVSERGIAGVAAVERAKAICSGCPVRVTCLADTMTRETASARYGVFGGLSARERIAFYRDLRATALAADTPPSGCPSCEVLFAVAGADDQLCPSCRERGAA